MTGNNVVALAFGLASAFFPYRLAHLPGHLPQMATQWIPLCFYAVERYIRTRQTRWAVGVGVMVGLNALSSWYTLVFIALGLPVYVLLRAPGLVRQIVRTSAARRDAIAGAAGGHCTNRTGGHAISARSKQRGSHAIGGRDHARINQPAGVRDAQHPTPAVG